MCPVHGGYSITSFGLSLVFGQVGTVWIGTRCRGKDDESARTAIIIFFSFLLHHQRGKDKVMLFSSGPSVIGC
jgi:hypothetical protein